MKLARSRWLLLTCCSVVLGATALTSATALAGRSAAKPTITIGLGAALTGPFAAPFGADFADGVVLAVRQINAKGGIAGHKLALEVDDHKGDPATGAIVMQKFASEHIPVVISSFTGVLKAQGPIATSSNTLVLNPAGSEPTIALASPFIYTARPYSTREFIVLSRYMKQKGVKSVAIVASDSANGRSADGIMRSQLTVKGLSASGSTQFYNAATTVDFSSVIAVVKSQHPDAVFVYGTGNDGGVFVNQAVGQGITVPFFSYGGFSTPTTIAAAGAGASHVTWDQPAIFDPATIPAHQKFATQWAKNFPGVAPPDAFSALNYDAVKCVLAPLIESIVTKGGTVTGPTLIAAMRAHKGAFTGCITGDTKFTHGRDAIKAMALQTYQNGKVVNVKTFSVADQLAKVGG